MKRLLFRSDLCVLLTNMALLLLYSLIVLSIHQSSMFNSIDGHFELDLIKLKSEWNTHIGLGMNIFQGMGDISFPIFPDLDLVFLLGVKLFDALNMPMIIYSLLSLQYFLSAFLLCRAFHFNHSSSLIASWIITLFVMPLVPNDSNGIPLFYSMTSMAPHWVNLFFTSTLIIFLFQKINQKNWFSIILIELLILALVIYMTYIGSMHLVVLAPFCVWFCFWNTYMASTKREMMLKISCLISIITLLIAIKYFYFLYGLFGFTTAHLFPHTLEPQPGQLSNISLIFLYPFLGFFPASSWLAGLGSVGMLISIIKFNDDRQRYALMVFSFIILLIVFGLSTTSASNWYHGPLTLYYEMIFWPLYAAYTITLVQIVSLRIKFLLRTSLLANFLDQQADLAAITQKVVFPGLLCILFLNFYYHVPQADSIVYPPKRTQLIQYLQKHLALSNPGEAFSGYVATFNPKPLKGEGMNWFKQLTFDNLAIKMTGNDYRMNGLWHFNIPTLIEYNPLLSPALYYLLINTMARSIDKQQRDIVIFSKPNFSLLAALGVRYIISDTSYHSHSMEKEGVKQVLTLPMDQDNIILHLYEIQNANIATYNPTTFYEIVPVARFLEQIKQLKIDFKKEVYVEKMPEIVDFVQPTSTNIKAVKDGIEIDAQSNGISTILLPILYSHCLQQEFLGKKPNTFFMLRANLAETLIIFDKQVHLKLSYHTGLLKYSNCRIQDMTDIKAIV